MTVLQRGVPGEASRPRALPLEKRRNRNSEVTKRFLRARPPG